MKYALLRTLNRLRILTAIVLGGLSGHYGNASFGIAITATLLLVNPFHLGFSGVGPTFPNPGGSNLAQIVAVAGSDAQQVLWELEIIQSAYQQNPFSDNMVGKIGSGKPIIDHSDLKVVAGQSIVIPTIDSLGAPIIQGNGIRVGNEEQLKPGDFRVTTSIAAVLAGIDNTGMTQSVVGQQWDRLTQKLLARRLAKQQNDDRLTCLKFSATSVNTKFPNGKSIDTLGTADVFQTSLIKGSAGLAKDLGTIPMNVNPNPATDSMEPPPIFRYMQFLTDSGARPIFDDALYLQGLSYAADRGKDNPLFTGVYQEWDNNIIYPWVNVRHGGYGSIGSPLQPEALLGTAIAARTTTTALPGGTNSTTAGGINGGGNTTAATIFPYRFYFENFSRFTWTPIAGTFGTFGPGSSGGAIPLSYIPRATYSYVGIIDKTTGLLSYLSYTTNSVITNYGNVLSGVLRLGSVAAGGSSDYVTTLPGSSIVWNTAPYVAAGDGASFLGLTDGVVASGSVMYEVNAKGVPLCFGLALGEMALVEGYSRVPVNNGMGMATMINRVEYTYPYGQAFGRGVQVAWGCAAFQRPDGVTPNYVLTIFARSVSGFPIV